MDVKLQPTLMLLYCPGCFASSVQTLSVLIIPVSATTVMFLSLSCYLLPHLTRRQLWFAFGCVLLPRIQCPPDNGVLLSVGLQFATNPALPHW